MRNEEIWTVRYRLIYGWSKSSDTGPYSQILNNHKFLCRIEAICQKDSDKEILEKLAEQYNAAFQMEWPAFRKAREAIAKKYKAIRRSLKKLKNVCKKFFKNCVF